MSLAEVQFELVEQEEETEIAAPRVVHMIKRNATNFAIDGGNGGTNGQY